MRNAAAKRRVSSARPTGRRLSHEKSQEDRSHGQLQDWLARLGWNANRLPSDLGEDLLVQIYDDGVSTGLTFLAQLKSTTDAMALESKRSPRMIRYALEVKDLLHWEVSTTPVVLILWDVHAQHGYWQPVQAMVRELDERSRAWRRKVKVTASVPLANETTGDGARRLRWAIAKLCHPIIPKKLDEMMKCTLSFPNDEEGRVAVAAFERALDMGESVELDGRFVSELQFPEWHRRAYSS